MASNFGNPNSIPRLSRPSSAGRKLFGEGSQFTQKDAIGSALSRIPGAKQQVAGDFKLIGFQFVRSKQLQSILLSANRLGRDVRHVALSVHEESALRIQEQAVAGMREKIKGNPRQSGRGQNALLRAMNDQNNSRAHIVNWTQSSWQVDFSNLDYVLPRYTNRPRHQGVYWRAVEYGYSFKVRNGYFNTSTDLSGKWSKPTKGRFGADKRFIPGQTGEKERTLTFGGYGAITKALNDNTETVVNKRYAEAIRIQLGTELLGSHSGALELMSTAFKFFGGGGTLSGSVLQRGGDRRIVSPRDVFPGVNFKG